MQAGKPLRVALATLLLFLALALGAQAAPDVGMVTRTAGLVHVVPAAGGKAQPADLLRGLQSGDRLMVPSGGSASVVVFADGHSETVLAGTFKMTARGLEGKNVVRSEASRALAGLRTGTAAGGARGAVTTRTTHFLPPLPEVQLAPAALVERACPVVGLPEPSGSGAVRTVALLDSKGEVLESRRLGEELTWRPQKALAPGSYQVVIVEEGGEVQSRRPLVVRPENPELAALLEDLETNLGQDDPAPWILASFALEREGLLESALAASWQAQARQASPALLRYSADLARRLGRTVEAAAWERLARRLEAPASP